MDLLIGQATQRCRQLYVSLWRVIFVTPNSRAFDSGRCSYGLILGVARLMGALFASVLSPCEPERNEDVCQQHKTQRSKFAIQFAYAHRCCH